jgi:tripartite motif-containing protein 71
MPLGRFDFLEIGEKKRAVLRTPQTAPVSGLRRHFRLREIIGGPGDKLGEFSHPGGLAIDSKGDLFVADTFNHRLQKITPEGDVYGYFGRRKGASGLLRPLGVVIDSRDFLYVVEQGNPRISRFNPEGKLICTIGGSKEFSSPAGICLDGFNNLFISDCGEKTVKSFTPYGRRRQEYYYRTASQFELRCPQGVTCDQQSDIYIADTLGGCVLKTDATGETLLQIGKPGFGKGELNLPQDLAIDLDGGLLVVEAGNHRLQKFDSRGKSVAIFPGPRQRERLSSPAGVTIDAQGNIYLADSLNHRILLLTCD